jgi:hypothetical protein
MLEHDLQIIQNPIVVLGQSASQAVTINDCLAILIQPQPPLNWLKGELWILSEAHDAFYSSANGGPYLMPDYSHNYIPYVAASAKDASGKTRTYKFTGFVAIIYAGKYEVGKNQDGHVYPFIASYVRDDEALSRNVII